ncbi:MAG: cytochrome c maturation protein CcmE, partial [Euryarchaeota archaeon]|nr:cytochrome c maturation protein CcmE [Euryarchaeota archaeon]NOZ59608.1 cytochrome c maturation protein CcmE [Euryarchaeota archaeon]
MSLEGRNLRYVVGVLVVLVFLGIALSTATSESFVNPYKSVSDVVEDPGRYEGRQVQVQGYVVKESVEWAPRNLNFTLTD